jgi:hypothetical protein
MRVSIVPQLLTADYAMNCAAHTAVELLEV